MNFLIVCFLPKFQEYCNFKYVRYSQRNWQLNNYQMLLLWMSQNNCARTHTSQPPNVADKRLIWQPLCSPVQLLINRDYIGNNVVLIQNCILWKHIERYTTTYKTQYHQEQYTHVEETINKALWWAQQYYQVVHYIIDSSFGNFYHFIC